MTKITLTTEKMKKLMDRAYWKDWGKHNHIEYIDWRDAEIKKLVKK